MANNPQLNLPTGFATSPARGAEMRDFLTSRLRTSRQPAQQSTPTQQSPPPLVHSWTFWHDRQDRSSAHVGNSHKNQTNEAYPAAASPPPGNVEAYEDRLVPLAEIEDVGRFWAVLNNFDVLQLPLRDSVHLFKRGVKPIWEDPRNSKGGSWTFRVPKSQAGEFWKEICMMAVGEQLQTSIDSGRDTFRDDICGLSLGVRFNSMLLQVWNRDGDNTTGIAKLLTTILTSLSPALGLREGSYYYKRHSEHASFTQPAASSSSNAAEPNAYLTEPAKGTASVTKSSPPPRISQGGENVTREDKNDEPIEDMRQTLTEMEKAMAVVAEKEAPAS